jgi:hypothetical protein
LERVHYFLLRIGSNWQDYTFQWEPFRDLAGPLNPPSGALPIAVVSVGQATEPTTQVSQDPFPHVEITTAPTVPVVQFVETWISALRGQRVELVRTPSPWFLAGLRLRAENVSAQVLAFLGLGESEATSQVTEPDPDGLSLSQTLRKIAEELPSAGLTAFDIASAIAIRHPEYASGRLGSASLVSPPDAATHGWALWRDSVTQLYERTIVAASKHQVIDGRLFLVGLGLVESSLRSALDGLGCWAPLLLEVDEAVAPPGSALWSVLQAVLGR